MAWRGSTGRSWSGKALAAISLWSTSFVAIRVALESFSPAAIVTARLVLGALGLLAFLAWRDRKRVIPEPGERRGPILLGLVLAAHLFLQSLGLETTTAVHAGWIVGFATVPTALGAWLLLGERIRARGWLGIALATGGVLWILVAVTPGFERAHFGDTLQVVACFTWSAYALLGARLVVRSDPLAVTAVSMAVGALALAAAGALAGGLQTDVPLTARSLVALAILGLGGTALPFALWNQAVQEHGTVRTSSYLYLEPFGVAAAAWLVLREPLTPAVFGGGVLVLLGMWAVAGGSSRPTTG